MSSPPVPGAIRRRTPDPGSRWASLHIDLVGLVASHLLAGDLLDYVRFRAVCTGWRSGTASPRGCGVADPRFHPRRWMMFPEDHPLYPRYVRFLNLDTGTLVRLDVPLLGNHSLFQSIDGLLLLLRDSDREAPVRLLNPFTGDTAEFPPLGSLLRQVDASDIPGLMCRACASVSFDSGAITIMLALRFEPRVAFATSLDRQWTLSSWECWISYPPFSFQGKLYIIDTTTISNDNDIHQVFKIDPPLKDRQIQPPKLIATIPAHKLVYPDGLVHCGSEILVLGHNVFCRPQILVFKLADLVLQRFTPITNIGGNTLFLGDLGEMNISVSSKILPTVKGDNVIYTRIGTRPHLAQYHLSSGALFPAIDNCSLYGLAPGPSSLVLHIFSCSCRYLWMQGQMYRRNINLQAWVADEQDVEIEGEAEILPPLVGDKEFYGDED